MLRGAATLADAVRVTLGPKSRCVLLERKWGRPEVSDDGMTIAKEVELEDPYENLGAQMIRQAAERTGDRVGDGTTTSTLLACELYAEGVRNIAAAGRPGLAFSRRTMNLPCTPWKPRSDSWPTSPASPVAMVARV